MMNVLIAKAGEKLVEKANIATTAAALMSALGLAGTIGAVGMNGVGKVLIKIGTKK